MKSFSALVVAAIFGSLITIGAYHFLGFNQLVIVKEVPASPAALTKNTNSTTANNASNFFNTSTPTANPLPVVDFTSAATKTTPAVVHIRSSQKQVIPSNYYDPFDAFRRFFDDAGPSPHGGGQGGGSMATSSGSGVIISNDGYIVTNNHVIEGADELEVSLHDKRKYKATVIGTDPSTDLALIKVEDTGLPTLQVANSDNVQVGEWVLAVGNPFNLESTVTAGIVSAKGRNLNILDDRSAIESFIQTDAAVNPGNSGGALVNTKGELIGINTAIATPTGTYAGYAFAVPANIVQKVIDDLMDYGVVQRAFIGVVIRDLDGNLAKELDLDITQGVYVDDLMPNGSAANAGIEKGDVIIKVDGTSVNSAPSLQEIVASHRPGDDVSVTVYRNGKEHDIIINLKNKQGNTEVVTKSTKAANLAQMLGAEFQELSSKEAQALRVKGGIQVQKLLEGKLSKSTDIQEGFIITKIDGKPVTSVQDLQQMINSKKGGVLLEGIYPGYPNTYYYGLGLE